MRKRKRRIGVESDAYVLIHSFRQRMLDGLTDIGLEPIFLLFSMKAANFHASFTLRWLDVLFGRLESNVLSL